METARGDQTASDTLAAVETVDVETVDVETARGDQTASDTLAAVETVDVETAVAGKFDVETDDLMDPAGTSSSSSSSREGPGGSLSPRRMRVEHLQARASSGSVSASYVEEVAVEVRELLRGATVKTPHLEGSSKRRVPRLPTTGKAYRKEFPAL